MVNLSTNYMGLKLKNPPIIVGSSGLTNSVENIKEAAANGAAAVVLKSLFEEQIKHSASHTLVQDEYSNFYPEAEDYVRNYTRHNDVDNYIKLIRDSKKKPWIFPSSPASTVFRRTNGLNLPKKIEEAGADGLELNVFVLPSDPHHSAQDNEKVYFEILEKITKIIKYLSL